MSTAGGGSRSLRDRRVARVIDREIAPIWHDRFARLILRNLPPGTGQFVLDLHSGPGRLTTELLTRLDDSSRVLAIEPDDTLIELAKTRVRPEWRNRVYFKGGSFEDVLGMGAGSYDLTIANLVLGEGTELAPAVGELLRVSKPGGHVLATLPLQGSWQEVEDIFAEVLRDAGLTQASRRLERLRSLRPPASLLGDLLREMNCPRDNYVIESERLQMIFPSGREFLFAPVIEHGPLRLWKAIIGDDGSPQELFWRLKEAIDVYYSGQVLSVTVVAGLIHVQIPNPEEYGPSLAARYWSRYPELDRLWGGLAAELTAGRQPVFAFSDEDLDIDIDLDIDFGMDDDEPEPAPEPPPQEPIKPSSEDLDYQPYAYGDEWEEDAEEAGELAGAIASGAAASSSAEHRVAEVEELDGEPEYEELTEDEPEPAYAELTEDEPELAAEPEYEELTEDEPEPEYEDLAFESEAAPEPAYEDLALEPEVAAEPEPAYEDLALEPEVAAEPESASVDVEPEVAAAPEHAEAEAAGEPELGGDLDAADEASFADLEGDEDDEDGEENRFDDEDEPDAGSSIADQIEAELAEMSAAPPQESGDEAEAADADASEVEAEADAEEASAEDAADEDDDAEAAASEPAGDEVAVASEASEGEAAADEAASADSEGAEAEGDEDEGAEAEGDEDEGAEAEGDESEGAESEGDEPEGDGADEDEGPKRRRLGGLPLKLGGRPSKPVKFRAPSFTPPVSTPRPKSEPGDDEGEGEGEGAEARSDEQRARRLPGLPGLPKLPGFKPPSKPAVSEEPEPADEDEDAGASEDEDEVLELEDDLIEVDELEEIEEEEEVVAKPRKPPPPPPRSFKPRPLLPIVPPKPKPKKK